MTVARWHASSLLVSILMVVSACSLDQPVADPTGTRQSRTGGAEERGVKVKGIRTIKLDAPAYGTIMAWSPDSRRLAVGGPLDRRVSVWDVRTGQRVPGPGDQQGGPQALAFSPDGRYLAVARGGVRFRADVPVPTDAERYVVSLWDA
ncbi:MAG TPA: WD40 repeat domain-containing protein, partial [Candidatus Bathyarchaeia archaeon]|nr:WD40 repeat domain-containing protein [Candidatus Bathyarchaeia archaeon]